ncbi:ATP-binding protein [Micromonospora sp. NPDC049559]|uniref:ATP-binding protein n=1 Tax=Micromonospora sp. NPDC049559 TaxID=3155923 RepID=UPI00342DD630
MTENPLLTSLAAAVQARPDDLPLRLHLSELLLDAGRLGEAITEIGQVLVREPENGQAQLLMRRALGGGAAPQPPAPPPLPVSPSAAAPVPVSPPAGASTGAAPPAEGATPAPGEADTRSGGDPLTEYARELSEVVPPRFVPAPEEPEPVRGEGDRVYDAETSTVRLADVGGMTEVKQRLELAFLGPLRNPELRRLYGKSLRGGLLLYGPPGCGKTFLAKAVAGEMGARFMSLSIVDVLDMWIGRSERNLHELFEAARRAAPCVLFLDEVDALGHQRSRINSSAMRTIGNQLLAELDGVDGSNEGVFVLAATNTPWDVDAALRRPGRLDRMLLVLPPDAEARAAIIQYHLRERPIANIDLARIVAATEDFSGADLAHLCEAAAEYALADSIQRGEVRMIEQRDFDRAGRDLRPSTGSWFATARNVALFGNESGAYDDLVAYLKRKKLIR